MIAHLNRASDFYDSVERMVAGGSTHLDAIIEWCTVKGLEMESVAPLITRNSNLISKLREEAESLNWLPRSTRLPV